MAWSFTEWYEENKREFLKKRKLKYILDKKFRDNMKERSRNYYKENLKKNYPRTVMIIKGKKFLTIGGLAQLIKRNEQTIREYHMKGILPETDRGNDRGWRVYSIPRTKIIKEAFEMFGREELKSLKEVKEYVHERW